MSSPASTALDESIFHSLRRISRAIDLYSRQLSGRCRLTAPQLVCMRHLLDNPCSPGQLAASVALSPPTVTGILDRLQARGLVTRTRHPSDGRRLVVELTEAGRGVLATAPKPLQECFARNLARMALKEQQTIDRVLKKMVLMMETEPEAAATTSPED